MSSKSRPATRATSEETKNQIKAAAQILFAQRGVDGVTVQEIVNAAGQRNNAALHYHFGSKEELIRQMVVDGASVLDERRRGMLLEIEARGGPSTIREVMLVLLTPVIELGDDERWRGYIRFTSSLQASAIRSRRSASKAFRRFSSRHSVPKISRPCLSPIYAAKSKRCWSKT